MLRIPAQRSLQRNLQAEWMDEPDIDPELHRGALRGLARLNRVTGIAGIMYRQIRAIARTMPGKSVRVLDIASGSGDLAIAWARQAHRDSIPLEITTTDRSPLACDEQRQKCDLAGVSLTQLRMDCLQDDLPSGFDICTNSLFLHHLPSPDAVQMIQRMAAAAKQVVLCDLERTRLNRLLVIAGSRLTTRSPIVHTDARRSIEGAFSVVEMQRLLRDALQRPIPVRRIPPCRMLAVIDQS